MPDQLVVFIGVDPTAGWYWQRETAEQVVVDSTFGLLSKEHAQSSAWRYNQDLVDSYATPDDIPERVQEMREEVSS